MMMMVRNPQLKERKEEEKKKEKKAKQEIKRKKEKQQNMNSLEEKNKWKKIEVPKEREKERGRRVQKSDEGREVREEDGTSEEWWEVGLGWGASGLRLMKRKDGLWESWKLVSIIKYMGMHVRVLILIIILSSILNIRFISFFFHHKKKDIYNINIFCLELLLS